MTHEVCIVGVCPEGEGSVGSVTLCQIGGEVPEFSVC